MVKIGVINVSDRASKGIYEDIPGKAIVSTLKEYLTHSFETSYAVIPDEQDQIESTLIRMADEEKCCLIVTCGGTGPALRDVTPEATIAVCEKMMPGFAVRYKDPKDGKRYAVAYKDKAMAQAKMMALKGACAKDISITKHTLNFKEAVELEEGKMKKIATMFDQGKSAEEIANALKLPVSTVKSILGEEKEKERLVKGMKKNKDDFKKRYGDDAEAVMYATATKNAKANASIDTSDIKNKLYDALNKKMGLE